MPSAAAGLGRVLPPPVSTGVRELFDAFLSEDPGYSAQLSVYHHGTQVLDLCGGPGFAPATSRAPTPVPRESPPSSSPSSSRTAGSTSTAPSRPTGPSSASTARTGSPCGRPFPTRRGCPASSAVFPWRNSPTPAAARRLAAAAPLWRPGTAFGYHALTMGILMEELCRRASGMTLQGLYDERTPPPVGHRLLPGPARGPGTAVPRGALRP